MGPPSSNSFSVSVVFPASGCEIIANVRRRAISRCRSLFASLKVLVVLQGVRCGTGNPFQRDEGDCILAFIAQAESGAADIQALHQDTGMAVKTQTGFAALVVDDKNVFRGNAILEARTEGLGGCFLGCESLREKNSAFA